MARAMTRRLSQFGTLSLSGMIGVLAGCACCGPADSADENPHLLAERTPDSVSAHAMSVGGAPDAIAAGRLKLADVSGDPALRDALMQVSASFEGIQRRYQNLNAFSTHQTANCFKSTLIHLQEEKLAAYNPDQDKDLQKLIDRLLERNTSPARRFSQTASTEWAKAGKTELQSQELKLLDRLDDQLELLRTKVASAMVNIPASGVALTNADLWEMVQVWRSYSSASGTPGFNPSEPFKPADPPVP